MEREREEEEEGEKIFLSYVIVAPMINGFEKDDERDL
jgi:hypothetical protein